MGTWTRFDYSKDEMYLSSPFPEYRYPNCQQVVVCTLLDYQWEFLFRKVHFSNTFQVQMLIENTYALHTWNINQSHGRNLVLLCTLGILVYPVLTLSGIAFCTWKYPRRLAMRETGGVSISLQNVNFRSLWRNLLTYLNCFRPRVHCEHLWTVRQSSDRLRWLRSHDGLQKVNSCVLTLQLSQPGSLCIVEKEFLWEEELLVKVLMVSNFEKENHKGLLKSWEFNYIPGKGKNCIQTISGRQFERSILLLFWGSVALGR